MESPLLIEASARYWPPVYDAGCGQRPGCSLSPSNGQNKLAGGCNPLIACGYGFPVYLTTGVLSPKGNLSFILPFKISFFHNSMDKFTDHNWMGMEGGKVVVLVTVL